MTDLQLSDYLYDLPQDRIATYGLSERDQSKLLVYQKGEIQHRKFRQLPGFLPPDTTIFFNNTKVIQARLLLKRRTGALIEVFLLSPAGPLETIPGTLQSTEPVVYRCMIGNLKKWKTGEILHENVVIKGQKMALEAELIDREQHLVKFSWNSAKTTFYDILNHVGHTPLPPYIKRPDEAGDKERYQTVYSKIPGAVAAPTAGLHFTEQVLQDLLKTGTKTDYLTLHVSAGTFQPIKEDIITNHPMHSERILLTKNNLLNVIGAQNIIPVGTTAMRTLESTYWFGYQLLRTGGRDFKIAKLAPYSTGNETLPTRREAFEAVLNFMVDNKIDEISGETEIFIFPGYHFRVCNGLITNFHQPGSTLILLVAAFVGNNWRQIYTAALQKDYRFLSYGDSSLLLP